ncbi:Uncharacterised protein [Legionella wadsworthii]|uniref:Uncharacterized protein n=1 Tax=Legionella wadsworthii TaxID=28088 RepID=A0A378LVU3_9GAMM|nr:hypothetical protein [Legionella wadsworthii]STY29928.1 Uncharacterised protein [Legionella wadsworthii]
MIHLFTDIWPMLIQYKNANARTRTNLVKKEIEHLTNLSGKISLKDHAKHHYKVLAYAATLIAYADVLFRMENQMYFDILFDFYSMEMDEKLNDWFEFGTTPGHMRLKHPLIKYTPEIWEKFRVAQKAHLKKNNKLHLFNLEQLDIYHPPANQLYPIQIQMGGHLYNEAVDRIHVDAHGHIRFAHLHGFYLLPGGGMLEKPDDANIDDWRCKMLEEHLEEEHANLYLKAAEYYNQISQIDFHKILIKICSSHEAQNLTHELREKLKSIILSSESNSHCLKNMISELDHHIDLVQKSRRNASRVQEEEKQNRAQNFYKSLITLRALVQVQTFKLTPLFSKALNYLKKNTVCVNIQQYLDTRVLGGFQLSHCFILTGQPLEDWFSTQFQGVKGQFGDDISASAIVRLTLLEALESFKKIKFSHLLNGLAAYDEGINRGVLLIENIWDEAQFIQARQKLCVEAASFMKK